MSSKPQHQASVSASAELGRSGVSLPAMAAVWAAGGKEAGSPRGMLASKSEKRGPGLRSAGRSQVVGVRPTAEQMSREADHRAHALLRKSDAVFQTPLQTHRQIFGSTLRTPCLPGGRLRRRYSHVKGRTRLEKISSNTFSRASV